MVTQLGQFSDPNQKYLFAAARENLAAVQRCLNGKADPRAVDKEGKVLDAVKAQLDTLKAKKAVIGEDACADELEDRPTGWTALHFACAYGHARVVRFLAEQHSYLLEKEDSFGNTPIFLTIRRSEEFLESFLKAKANLGHRNNEGLTPLHVFAIEEDSSFLQLAVTSLKTNKAAASVFNSQTKTSQHTPLCMAIEEGNEAAVALLREYTNLDLKDAEGKTIREKLAAFDSSHSKRPSHSTQDACCAIL